MAKASPSYLTHIKTMIFPNPYNPSSSMTGYSMSSTSRSNKMDPTDIPPNTMRCELIKLMTSFDSNIKRCVAELLFALCKDNGE